jgi:hypothetical protein
MSDIKKIVNCECSEHILEVETTLGDYHLSMWNRESDKERGRLYCAWQALKGAPRGVGSIILDRQSADRLIQALSAVPLDHNGKPHEHEWGEWTNWELNPYLDVRHCTQYVHPWCVGGVESRFIGDRSSQ